MRAKTNPPAESDLQARGAAPCDSAEELFRRVLDRPPKPSATQTGISLATLTALNPDGSAEFAIDGLATVRAAHSLIPLDARQLGCTVALSFDQGNIATPIVLGLVGCPASNAISAPELRVDGQRVVIEAEQEIELRCGEAAIVLGADGHIQLRGTYITSQASATQRILGGSVNVN